MNPFARFETIVAFRFMREGLTQTLLILFGVALGVGVIIFMSALLAGLQSNIVRRTLNFQAPIEILAPDQVARQLRESASSSVAAQIQPRSQQLRSVDQWQKVITDVARVPGVIGVTPVVSGPGFARRGEAIKSVTITGIDTDSYFDVIALPEKIVAGRFDVGPLDIIIGVELAKDLGMAVGDKLTLTTAAGVATTLSVIGIFDFGNKGVNERSVYVELRTAQSLLDLVGGASSIQVKVHDPFAAETIAQTIREGTDLQVDSWIRTNAQFFSAMAAQILANRLIRFFRRAHRRAGDCQRAGRVGCPEGQGNRHPAGDGDGARPDTARVPDPGRFHGADRCRCRRAACLGLPAALARRRQEPRRHATVHRGHRAVAVRDGLRRRDDRGRARRRRCRHGARRSSTRRWRSVVEGATVPTLRLEGVRSPMVSARRSRPRSCTAST